MKEVNDRAFYETAAAGVEGGGNAGGAVPKREASAAPMPNNPAANQITDPKKGTNRANPRKHAPTKTAA